MLLGLARDIDVAALPGGELPSLHREAQDLGLSVLVEVHDERELDTALGTVLTFTRGNVAYTVLGSVPAAAAEAAARAL